MGILGDGHGTANIAAGGLVAWLTGRVVGLVLFFAVLGGIIWFFSSPISDFLVKDQQRQVQHYDDVTRKCDADMIRLNSQDATTTDTPACREYVNLLNGTN